MTTITNADREAARKELDHLLRDTFSIPMAVEHLAQLRANDREQARREALEEAAANLVRIADVMQGKGRAVFAEAYEDAADHTRALIGETK